MRVARYICSLPLGDGLDNAGPCFASSGALIFSMLRKLRSHLDCTRRVRMSLRSGRSFMAILKPLPSVSWKSHSDHGHPKDYIWDILTAHGTGSMVPYRLVEDVPLIDVTHR